MRPILVNTISMQRFDTRKCLAVRNIACSPTLEPGRATWITWVHWVTCFVTFLDFPTVGPRANLQQLARPNKPHGNTFWLVGSAVSISIHERSSCQTSLVLLWRCKSPAIGEPNLRQSALDESPWSITAAPGWHRADLGTRQLQSQRNCHRASCHPKKDYPVI